MILSYFFIALVATILGSAAGLGGGVIIKPILDFLGDFNVVVIGIMSTFTVFSMAIISVIRQIKYKAKIEFKKTSLIGIGAIIGGVLGDKIMSLVLSISNETIVKLSQSLTLTILLIFIYIYMNNKERYKSYNVNNFIGCISIGLLLGTLSSFLSIGGGPINVCILTIFFSMDTKEATVNSIITILFSQGSKIVNILKAGTIASVNFKILIFMIIGGIVGGLVGSKLNKQLKSEYILKIFNFVLLGLILLNSYNVISIFL